MGYKKMKTAIILSLLLSILILTGCSHYGMHHYYNAMDQGRTITNSHFQQSSGSLQPDGNYPR